MQLCRTIFILQNGICDTLENSYLPFLFDKKEEKNVVPSCLLTLPRFYDYTWNESIQKIAQELVKTDSTNIFFDDVEF